MERYEKYKDSGFEWIGEIPEHWEVKKLKYIAFANPSSIDKKSKKEEQEVFLCNYVDVYKNDFIRSGMKFMKATASDSQIEKFILEKGDVIATKDSETPDDIGVPALVIEDFNDVVCGYHLTHIKPFDINGEFLFLFFQTQYLKSYFEISANGVTRYGLGVDKINSAFIIKPPFKEQTAIANYLDRKTAEIDELIKHKEQLLKLYEEEKTAIINQAVTKGLNYDCNDDVNTMITKKEKNHSSSENHIQNHSSRQFKNSGIDWLGEIPEHWEVKKLKYLANANPSNIDKKSKDGEDEVLLCNYVDVYKNDFINSELYFMRATASESQIEKFILEKGDVIATKDSETPDDIGNPALVIEYFENVVCGYHLTHIKPININGDFLFRFIQTQFIKSYFEVSANGITRYGLGVDKFNSALILCPPEIEQTAIVQYIETEINRINAKAEKTKKLIDLLKEYKQSLISEVVTGKVKVS